MFIPILIQLLATMSSSRSDSVTQFVSPLVTKEFFYSKRGKEVSRVILGSFKSVSRKFQGCFEEVSMMF